MKLLILNYKNKSDRIARHGIDDMSNVNDYQDYILHTLDNIQFNKGDGLVTTQIVNLDVTDNGNYLLALDGEDIIQSRWYIIESRWLRAGQTQLTLARDVVDDYLDRVFYGDSIVERAMLDINDSLIYNDEPIKVNQIKTNETLLKDETGVPWLVAYVAKGKGINVTDEEDLKANAYYKQGATLADLPLMSFFPEIGSDRYNQTANLDVYDPAAVNFNTYCAGNSATDMEDSRIYKMAIKAGEAIKVLQDGTQLLQTSSKIYNGNYNAGITSPYWLGTSNGGIGQASYENGPGEIPVDFTGASDIWVNPSLLDTAFSEYKSNLEQSPDFQLNTIEYLKEIGFVYDVYDANFNPSITQYNDRIYKIFSVDGFINRYFKYTVSAVSSQRQFIYLGAAADSDIAVEFKRFLIDQFGSGMYLDPRYGTMFSFSFPTTRYRVTITEVTPESIESSDIVSDANGAYNMICSPYADVDLMSSSQGTTVSITKEDILRQYQAIAKNNPGIVYDVQLLPYCPCRNMIANMNSIQDDGYIKVSDSITSSIISITNERQSFLILDNAIDAETTAVDKKKALICDKYRLCDPGYNGVFEFSAEKNNGVVYWNVDMTVKPYQPFIHVAPNFGGLYGSDFNDARGLTLGSNFSITTTSDRFAEYEIQNKNYQEMFNRQIQNMEVQHDLQTVEAWAQMFAGTLGAGVQGGTAGMLVGGGVGGIVGGIAGAAGSLATGAVDISNLEKRQAEELAYAQDMHNFQLDNIKALPDSLTRVSIFNNIYKNFPFVEYYTCTNEEKQVVDNYIKWNSMNVNAIGRIADYIQPTQTFIKAIPLRLSIPEDDHVAQALAQELSRGIYI